MKSMLKGIAVGMLLVAGLAGTASAQDVNKTRATKIDFDFYAGKQLMSAGEYEFMVVANSGPHKLIRVREVNTNKLAILSTVPSRNAQKLDSGSIAFNKYGDQYFLAGVQLGDLNFINSVTKSGAERDIARQYTGRRINTQASGQ